MLFSLLKRRKTGVKRRVAIGGIMIAMAALYALAISYDIPMRELGVYLLGSLALILGTALASLVVVVVFKLLKRVLAVVFAPLIRRLVSVDDQDREE